MIFFKYDTIDKQGSVIEFTALDNEISAGKCTLILDNNIAQITKIEYNEGYSYITEGLIKASLNYAANRSYYICRCSALNAEACLKRLGFVQADGYYESDIPSVLSGGCSGGCGH